MQTPKLRGRFVQWFIDASPVDCPCNALLPRRQVDGGNEWYPNTIRRGAALEATGILFVGMGVSGGEEGARHGPSLMPGCAKAAYDALEPILTACAAQVNGGACTTHCGPLGAGNYVKMVHNGIECKRRRAAAASCVVFECTGRVFAPTPAVLRVRLSRRRHAAHRGGVRRA